MPWRAGSLSVTLAASAPQPGVLLLAFGAGAFFRHFAAERHINRNLLVAHRFCHLFAGHRFFDVRRELFLLLPFPRDFTLPEFRHHILGEQFERFADIPVLVATALLDEHGLVDA